MDKIKNISALRYHINLGPEKFILVSPLPENFILSPEVTPDGIDTFRISIFLSGRARVQLFMLHGWT